MSNYYSCPLMNAQTLEFRFKGNRSYVQGPDIFNSVSKVAYSNDLGYISRLKFNFPLRSNAKFIEGNALEQFSNDRFCATGMLTNINNSRCPFALLPLADSWVRDRYYYDEEEITNALAINEDSKSATLLSSTRYSLMEEIVASIKFINNTLCLPDSKKWLFTGISLKSPIPESRLNLPLKVVLRQLIANSFSRNEVFLGVDHLGTVDFTLGEP